MKARLSQTARAFLSEGRQVARRSRRRLFRRLTLPGARVLFHPAYTLPVRGIVDGRRAARVVEHLVREGMLSSRDLIRPTELSAREMMRVHDPEYLARLDDPAELERIFASRRREAIDPGVLLHAQRIAAAGTVRAAELALGRRWSTAPVVNLAGGFHHARRATAGGFCAVNDVALAIDRVRSGGFNGNILVVDLDYHQGDGTRSIFADDPSVTTYSVHAQSWDQDTAASNFDVELGSAIGDETYLRALRETLPEAFSRAKPELLFFLAGADVASTDTLADWRVSADAILERDRMVLLRAASIPTVILPAGGYGPNAYRYTARTLAWLLSGEDLPIPTEEEAALKSFRAIRRSLESQELHADPTDHSDPFKLTEADIYGDLYQKTPDRRFLGFYSSFGLEIAFERYGLADHLRRRGYPHFVIDGDLVVKRGEQGARVYGDDTRHDLLIELTLAERVVDANARLMSIEWLTLQDPKRKPSGPLLPGQKHPGLGCLEIIVGMLIMACERLGYDGLTLVPSHFHVAAQARRLFSFWDPKDEAHFLALSRATHHLPLFDASLAVAHGFVVDKASGEPQHYHPARMVRPVSAELKSRGADPAYARAVEEASRGLAFELRCQPSK